MYEELLTKLGMTLDEIDKTTIMPIVSTLKIMADIIERNNLATEEELNEISEYIQNF